ncbi:beta-fructofuranosidase [Ranunculus cassubicifolius]
MYYNGYYHLFYQYNPFGSTWGNIVWAHSYSTDLINWIPLEPAIYPSEPFDINGTWSGSATILPGNKPVIMYTGINGMNHQVQNVAYPKNSSDPLLREWVKPSYNPVIYPNRYMNQTAFRDPTTAWRTKDGKWKVAVGHKRNTRGKVEIYTSTDFKTWTRGKHPLHSVPGSGMWECPDFFPVLLNGGKEGLETSVNGNHVKHVFKVSLDITRFDYYTVGKYFEEKDRYIPDGTSPDNSTGLRLDYGNFYASKTFFDEKNKRRILFGWANESDAKADDIRKGWAGIQAIPRNLWLDKSGKQVLQWPVEEIETLRGNVVHLKNLPLPVESLTEIKGITAAQADVDVTFNIPSLEYAEPYDPSWIDAERLCGRKDANTSGGLGPFGLLTLASNQLQEYTAIFFHIFKTEDKPIVLMCAGGPMSSLTTNLYKPSYGGFVDVDIKDGSLSLRSLIDHSVVESFGAGGKVCITSRVYPTLAIGSDAHLYLFNNGTTPITVKKLDAWSMNKARMS